MVLTVRIEKFGNNGNDLFENTEARFCSGNLYFIKGENGVGKTTLLSLLSGQIYDSKVTLSLNGKKIRRTQRDTYFKNNISYMTQDSLVFDDKTALENLLFPYPDKDKEKAVSILRKLGLTDVMDSMGADLSSGEKQRLCFGRVLYEEKPILLLDECFSNLDEENAKLISGCIQELSKDRIVIVVSHSHEDFLSDAIPCLISDHRISMEMNAKETNVETKKKARKEKHVNIFNENRMFGISCSIFSFLLLFFAVLSVSFSSIYESKNVLHNSFEILKKTSDVFLVKKESFDEVSSEIPSSDVMVISGMYNMDLSKKHCFSGVFATDDFSDFDLVKGRLPENETECIISSVMEEQYRGFDTEDVIHSIQGIYSFVTDIVGIYKAKDTAKIDTYLKNENEQAKQNTLRIAYGYMVESVFIRKSENPFVSFYAVKNNEDTRKYITADMIAFIDPSILFVSSDGKRLFSSFDVFRNPIFSILSYFGFFFVFLAYLFSFVISNRRYYLLLRTMGRSRKSLLKSVLSFFSVLLFGSVLAAILVSGIILPIMNLYFSGLSIADGFFLFFLPSVSFVVYSLIGVFFLFLILLFVTLILLLPTDMKKQIQNLKRK